jgi:DNA-binding MarR family transcriptional regulator
MKNLFSNLNKKLENKTRLGIMSALVVNPSIDFKNLKQLMNVTDGNLSSNIAVLEKIKYLTVQKNFIKKKSHTAYSITETGRKKFNEHLDTLESIIKLNKKG